MRGNSIAKDSFLTISKVFYNNVISQWRDAIRAGSMARSGSAVKSRLASVGPTAPNAGQWRIFYHNVTFRGHYIALVLKKQSLDNSTGQSLVTLFKENYSLEHIDCL